MASKCQVEEVEGRELDSYDMITILGLLKEHDWKDILRRYHPQGLKPGKINLHFSTEGYYMEMTVESLAALALSAKFQASPHLLQALIRRVLCNHRHSLILAKLRGYGVPIDSNDQLNLSCAIGNIMADLVVNHYSQAPEYANFRKFGTSQVEQEEQRPLDHYDVVSVLYLAQQNLTQRILERYLPLEILNEGSEGEKVVHFQSLAGDYQVDFLFKRISNEVRQKMPARGNVSTATMHQVIRRIFAAHRPELVAQELTDKGIIITPEEVSREFTLARLLNDNYLEMGFRHR
jgi:hypothetical protein